MKVKFIGLMAFVAMGLAGQANAYNFWSKIQDKTVYVTDVRTFGAITSTNVILIDKSDTTNFPHKDASTWLNITSVKIFQDMTTATATVKIGVINSVDASTGSVTWFTLLPNNGNTSAASPNRNLLQTAEYYIKTKVVAPTALNTDGTTPFILSNNKTSGSTIFQTDVVLPCPTVAGACFSGLGDIVMQVDKDLNTSTFLVEIAYHAE